MNREHRRALEKKMQKRGTTEGDIKRFFDAMSLAISHGDLSEGDKVKINADMILGRSNAHELSDRYKQFVADHRDEVFTVEYAQNRHKNHSIVQLAEDPTEVKWLWHELDLIRVEETNESC